MANLHVSGDNPADIHFDDVGRGRPVVLVHGWPLSSRSWEPQVAAFVDAGFRVVTYDRRGFGGSSQPWGGYDYDTLADDLAAVLEELDLRDAVLVGFSMGGGEVARYLARHGHDRVAGAVFAAAVPPYLHQADDNPGGGLDDAAIAEFEDGVRGDRIGFLDGFTRDFFTAGDRSDLVGEPLRLYQRAIAEFASPKGTLDCIGAFARTDFRDDLTRVTVPTLVVHGDSDGIVPFEVSGRRTHEAVAGSALVLVEGAPHGLNVTHAGAFNAAVTDFVRSLDGEAKHATADTAGRHEAAGTRAPAAGHETPVTEPTPAPDQPAAPGSSDRATGLDGLTWRRAEEDDPANQPVELPTKPAQRSGHTADPNLGDVPVEDQPHPGSL